MTGFAGFLRDAWRIARPYFMHSEERWSARGLMAAVVALSLLNVGLSVVLNFWQAEFYNALQNKDWDAFVSLLLLSHRSAKGLTLGFTPLAFTYITVSIYRFYLRQWLSIRWRRWLTDRMMRDWMTGQAYYRISLTAAHPDQGTDNPDQRIAEDIRDFCETFISLTLGFISHVVTLFSFLTILWGLSGATVVLGITIPGYLFWIALAYAGVGTWFTHLIGRPLAALNFRQQRVEADFRYALVRVRENVEGIALYRGEQEEITTLTERFLALVANFRAIMTRTKYLNMITVGYSQAAGIFPIVIIAPAYFAGRVTLGVMFQTVDAFGRVQGALSWVIDIYDTVATFRSVVGRLATFHHSIERARASDEHLVHQENADTGVRLTGVDLMLPDGTKLVENADLTIAAGTSAVISGRSGSGKSTLFRALSGIWPYARGDIRVPKDSLFLPQRPYIPLGTLRRAVAYPHDPEMYGRPGIVEALTAAGLAHLVDKLDLDENWAQSLSGGELQRVAIARALLAKPAWIFLDEATASLDPDSETAIYQTLKTYLPHTTLVSIAHRPSVARFHEERIRFERTGTAPGQLIVEAPANDPL